MSEFAHKPWSTLTDDELIAHLLCSPNARQLVQQRINRSKALGDMDMVERVLKCWTEAKIERFIARQSNR